MVFSWFSFFSFFWFISSFLHLLTHSLPTSPSLPPRTHPAGVVGNARLHAQSLHEAADERQEVAVVHDAVRVLVDDAAQQPCHRVLDHRARVLGQHVNDVCQRLCGCMCVSGCWRRKNSSYLFSFVLRVFFFLCVCECMCACTSVCVCVCVCVQEQ